jgi:hypothetical protein
MVAGSPNKGQFHIYGGTRFKPNVINRTIYVSGGKKSELTKMGVEDIIAVHNWGNWVFQIPFMELPKIGYSKEEILTLIQSIDNQYQRYTYSIWIMNGQQDLLREVQTAIAALRKEVEQL